MTNIEEVRDKILIQCYSRDIPPKIKAYIDSLLEELVRQSNCPAYEEIMEIKPKSLLNDGSLTDGDLGKIMGSNRNLEIIQSIIRKHGNK